MTTLENRPNEALLVIDVQKGVVAEAYERDAVVANVATLVDRAHAARTPVVVDPRGMCVITATVPAVAPENAQFGYRW